MKTPKDTVCKISLTEKQMAQLLAVLKVCLEETKGSDYEPTMFALRDCIETQFLAHLGIL